MQNTMVVVEGGVIVAGGKKIKMKILGRKHKKGLRKKDKIATKTG